MSQNLSDTILATLRDGVLIVNAEGEIIYSNQAAQDLFMKDAAGLLGHAFGFPVTPFEIQEIEILQHNKVLTVQMLATNIHWNDQGAFLLSLRDITELKRISSELELQKVKLEKSNKELEQYAYFASHDLKAPVRKITLFSSRLLKNEGVQVLPEVKEQIEKILNCGERMYSLIGGIAEYSGFSVSQHFVNVSLNEVVKGVLSDLDEQITEKDATIEIDNLPDIEASRVQMHQLFLNLISNAVKYSRKDVPPHVRIKYSDHLSHIEVSIIDNGIGLNNIHADKIFEPFQRLHANEYEGSGIGLAICKKIVEAHGGTIYVSSSPGNGAEFIFTLAKNPAAEQDN